MGDSEAVVPVTWQAMPGLEGAVGPCRSRCPWLRWSVMSTSPARKPFWSTSKRYRFDDPQGKFGVLYAGDSIETSFAESVIHERAVFQKGAYVVELPRLPRPAAGLVQQREDGADVCRFERRAHEGARDEQRVSASYADAQRLPRAIDQASPGCNGIRFVSRQHKRRHAMAISERSALTRRATRELTGPEQTTICATFNVRLI